VSLYPSLEEYDTHGDDDDDAESSSDQVADADADLPLSSSSPTTMTLTAMAAASAAEFWREVEFRLIATFDGVGLDEELKLSSGRWIDQIQLLRYQLVKAVEMATGVPLSVEAKQEIIKGDIFSPISSDHASQSEDLTIDSVGFVEWASPELPVNCFSKMSAMEASIREHDVQPTEEYCDMLSTLANPRDLFREKNRMLAGYTVDSVHNSLVKSKGAKRIDYIFAFDTLGSGFDMKTMQQLTCKDCRVKQTGDSAVSQLSDHFGVEAVLTL
jgi:hypothetical protein